MVANIQRLPQVEEAKVLQAGKNMRKYVGYSKKYPIFLLPAYFDDETKRVQIGFYAFLSNNGNGVRVRVTPKQLYKDPGKSMSELNDALVKYALKYR